MHLFHKWQDYMKPAIRYCLGESYKTTEPTEYRKCAVCDKVQKGIHTSQGMIYYNASQEEIDILNRKIVEGTLTIG